MVIFGSWGSGNFSFSIMNNTFLLCYINTLNYIKYVNYRTDYM